MPSQCVPKRQSVGLGVGRARVRNSLGPTGSSLRQVIYSALLDGPAGNAHHWGSSPLFAHRARPTPLKCKNEYLVLALEEETAAQAVVGSIVWAFRRPSQKAKES